VRAGCPGGDGEVGLADGSGPEHEGGLAYVHRDVRAGPLCDRSRVMIGGMR